MSGMRRTIWRAAGVAAVALVMATGLASCGTTYRSRSRPVGSSYYYEPHYVYRPYYYQRYHRHYYVQRARPRAQVMRPPTPPRVYVSPKSPHRKGSTFKAPAPPSPRLPRPPSPRRLPRPPAPPWP